MIRESWGGGEWQDHCRQLLGMRYGPNNIQFIPDRDRGDGGLEAYDFHGNAYQCYAAQEAYSVKTLTDAQKVKISTDIAKLSKDLAKTKKLLGDVVLVRWILLTPSFDSKDIVEYARMKSIRVRKDPRPFWCHESFEIVVATDEIFAAERAQLYSHFENKLQMDVPIPDTAAIFAAVSGDTANRLAEKLRAERTFAADEGRLGRYKSSLLGDYVRGQQQMERIENEYPLIYGVINRRLKSTLLGLDRELLGTVGAGPQLVEQLLQRLAANLQKDGPGLGSLLCEEIARYAVAEWFVDCPLYFPDAA